MGGKTATSTSQTTIPPEVLARYNAVNTMAQGAASKPYQSFGTQASDYIAQMNQQQMAGIGGVNAAAGSYQPYLDAATGATQAGMGSSIENIQKYMSPYLTNVADTTSALMRQSNEQAQSGALGAAAQSGAFGGDRAGIAAANLAGQNQLAMGKTMADIYNQGYGQAASLSQADLARQLQGGAQMAGLGAQAQGLGLQGAQAQLAAGTMQQQTEQAGKDAMIQDFMQRQGYPFQTAQFLANIALGTGVASGTTTAATRPVGFFQNLATGGRANGYADGGGVAGPMNYGQTDVGQSGYVPAGVLPVGDLMISDVPQDEQSSGLGDVMKIASMFMGGKAHGGAAVGRHGYQTDGAVRDEPGLINSLAQRAYASGMSLGDLLPANPEPSSAPIGPNRPVEPGLIGNLARAGSAAGRFLAGGPEPEASAPSAPPAASRPAGLGGPGTFQASGMPTSPRPSITLPPTENAVTGMEAPPTFPSPPAAGLSPETSLRPAPRPTGLAGDTVAADTMSTLGVTQRPAGLAPTKPEVSLFDAKIVPIESGGRQLDENGSPLTSSAGAVGAAQVMEATGPEAAKLAGLPWDRDRWMYDKEYNLALGRAYFNQQLRQFGSPEKAAAAYNAGPGAVRSAIDRATALGGNYLDYLPDETKAYVAKFSGGGDQGGLAGSSGQDAIPGGAVQTQTQPGGLGAAPKAYEDRNALGKFFNTPDGRLNKDAVMSILSGLGTMASSTSMSPITALLQGAGAGAATYSNLEQRRGEISRQGIANTSDLVKLYNDFTFSNPQYSNVGIEEFAKSQGVEHLLPQITGQGGAPSLLGAITPVTMQEARGYIDAGNGVQIPFMNDYASLNRVFNDYSAAPEGSRQRALAEQAKAKMAEIESTGYTTGIGPNGEAVNIPVDAVREKLGGMGTDVANVETTRIFRDEAQKRLPAIGGDVDRVDRQIGIYTSIPAGAWTEEKARLGAIASTLGLSGIAGLPEGDQIAKIEEAIKEKAIGISARGGSDGMTDYERQFISQSTATPNLQPEAIKKLLAIEKATLLREQDMLAGHSQWQSTASNPYDLNAYKAEFAAKNPISKYIKAVEAEMPTFAGETVTADSAPDGSTSVDARGRQIIKRNGVWELQ